MRIVCVHQGYELYGSDRSFLETLAMLRGRWPRAEIVAVLPQEGQLAAALEPYVTRVVVEPLWILRRRRLLRLATLGLFTLPFAVARAARHLLSADLVYINTSVVADHLVAARLRPGRVLAHVHEIPQGATLSLLRTLLAFAGAAIIFNSQATRRAFALPEARQWVVYNAVTRPAVEAAQPYDGARPLHVLQLGRLSWLKGQDVLVRAVEMLPAPLRDRVRVRIVGGGFEDNGKRVELETLVRDLSLGQLIEIEDFASDPRGHFAWADVVAVPSRLPESLGRVAIEALGCGRPPLVSSIGGLTEIVEDGRSGWLVPPGDAGILSQRLAEIIGYPASWANFPAAARARYEAVFAPERIAEELGAIFASKLEARAESAATSPGEPNLEHDDPLRSGRNGLR